MILRFRSRFRDQALVRQTAAEFDTLKPQVVVERLRPLAVAGNPWFGSAGELTAVAYMRMNKSDLAGPLFAKIAADEGVPDTIRQRAVQMAGAVGVDAVPQKRGSESQMTAKYRVSVALAALMALSACGIFKTGQKKTPTVGERVPILVSENGIQTDPGIADIQVLLPAAAPNSNWAQPGGDAAQVDGPARTGRYADARVERLDRWRFEPRAARRGARYRRQQAVRDRCRRDDPRLCRRYRRDLMVQIDRRYEGERRRAVRRRGQL